MADITPEMSYLPVANLNIVPIFVNDKMKFNEILSSPLFRNKIRDLFWGREEIIDEVLEKFKQMTPELVKNILIIIRSQEFDEENPLDNRVQYINYEYIKHLQKIITFEANYPSVKNKRESERKIGDLKIQLKQKTEQLEKIKTTLPNWVFSNLENKQ